MMKICAALIACALAAAGCSNRVYSPPSSAFGLGPLHTLRPNQQALDIEVATHSQVFDPPLHSGAGRFRKGIDERTEMSIEGTVLSLDDAGPSTASREIYAGRGGIRTSPVDGVTFSAGAGGGYAPAGGPFAALDSGISVGFDNCVLVPVLEASGFVSQPLDPRPIDVSENDTMLTDTPSRTIGGTVGAGVRLSLTPAACRRGEPGTWIYGGLSITGVADHDSSDMLHGVGLGVQIPL